MNCPEPYSPDDILKICAAGGSQVQTMTNSILKSLLNCKPFTRGVINFVRFRGGKYTDGEDIVMEGLVQTAKSLQENRYQGGSSISSYAFGVCKYKWLNVMKKKGLKTVAVDETVRQLRGTDNVEDWMMSEEAKKILWSFVEQQSGKCNQLLKFWALGYKTEEIAKAANISPDNVRKQTYKCRVRLKDWLKKHPNAKELLNGLIID